MFSPRASALRYDADRHARLIAAQDAHRKAKLLRPYKKAIRDDAARRFDKRAASEGFNAAMRELNAFARVLADDVKQGAAVRNAERITSRDRLELWSCDATVKAWAKRRADECATLTMQAENLDAAYCAARGYVSAFGIKPPDVERMTIPAALARMSAARWWRRAGRRWVTAGVEREELEAGRVHSHGARYVSNPSMVRAKEAGRRNRQLLLETCAVNECGEEFSLADLADKSTANLHIRFCEMMVRLKGLEACAERQGFGRGLFVTWTLASRWHRRLAVSGDPNPSYSGATPREAQDALCKQWASVRAKLKKWGVRYYGMRVAEPHHDGTPHWHMLVFTPAADEERVIAAIRRAALRESPDEPGAQACRFKVERIDSRGATGYVVKYVSKMTTGAGLSVATEHGADGERREVGKPAEAANRARVWASVHRIRQFQFFGGQPVGLWRELRRLREPIERTDRMTMRGYCLVEGARAAANATDYAAHARALGGLAVPRDQQPLALWKEERAGLNPYGEKVRQVRGVRRQFTVQDERIKTAELQSRLHEWAILTRAPKSGASTRDSSAAAGNSTAASAPAAVVATSYTPQFSFATDAAPRSPSSCDPAAVAFDVPWTRINNCICVENVTTAPDDPGGADPPGFWRGFFDPARIEGPPAFLKKDTWRERLDPRRARLHLLTKPTEKTP